MAQRFKDLMEERTGGRFRVVIFPSGQLGSERVTFEQLQVGAQEMAISGTPVLSGWVPEGQLFDLPFLFKTRDQGLEVLNGPLGDWWRQLLLKKTGVRSLGFLDYGFRHVYNSKRPIEKPSDLYGLKLRVLQSRTYISGYEAFGVQATPMNYGEVYSAMQQGVIDGGEANVIGFITDRLYEVGRFFSFTSITYNPITLLVSERFYRSLPEEIRELLDTSAAEALDYQRAVAREMEMEAIEQMKASGVSVAYPSTDEFIPVVRPRIWEDLAERLPDGKALLERLEREIDRVPTRSIGLPVGSSDISGHRDLPGRAGVAIPMGVGTVVTVP
jgi:tripartite ATP-independent transporter DctP family solute receptor